MCEKLEIFKPYPNKCRENRQVYNPQCFLAMPILFNELLFISYKNLVSCPDIKCRNFYQKLEINNLYNVYCKKCVGWGYKNTNEEIRNESNGRASNYAKSSMIYEANGLFVPNPTDRNAIKRKVFTSPNG